MTARRDAATAGLILLTPSANSVERVNPLGKPCVNRASRYQFPMSAKAENGPNEPKSVPYGSRLPISSIPHCSRSRSIVCPMARGSRPERRVCALCGAVYVAIVPAGWSPHTNDNLCGVCLMLPPPPAAPYEKQDTENPPKQAGDEPEEPQGTTA